MSILAASNVIGTMQTKIQIILSKEEYDKLKPLKEYTSMELVDELVERCKINSDVNKTSFNLVTFLRSNTGLYDSNKIERWKVTVEKVEE